MMKRIVVLDVGVLVLLVLGIVRFRQDWTAFNLSHQPSAIKPRNETLPGLPVGGASSQSTQDWTAIPSRNPFSFDRNDITLAAPPEASAPAKPVGPKPVLFGITDIGSSKLAIIAPGQSGADRNSRTVKAGETVDGWTVVQIDDTSIIVEANSVRETVIINDPAAKIPRDHSRTAATVESVSTAASRTASPSAQPLMPPPPVTPGSVMGTPQPSGQVLPDGSRIIQTPFGPHVVPKDPPQK